MGKQPVARPLPNKQTSMPVVGFEPSNPVLEQAKAFHALVHAAAVMAIGYGVSYYIRRSVCRILALLSSFFNSVRCLI
jgi:hypothetical protein